MALQQRSPLKSRASAAKRTWENRGVLHGTRDGFKDDTHLDRCLRSQIDVLESRGFVSTRREQMCFNHTGAVPRGSKLSPRVTTTKGTAGTHTVSRSHLCNISMSLCSGMGGSTLAPSNNSFFLEVIRFNDHYSYIHIYIYIY